MRRATWLGWWGAAAMAGAWPLLAQDYAPVLHGRAVGAALLAGALAAFALLGRRHGGSVLMLALPLAAALVSGAVVAALRPLEAGQTLSLPAFARLGALVARLAGESAAVVSGDLLLEDPQGAFRFAPTWGAVGWRPLLAFWVLAVLLASLLPKPRDRWRAALAALSVSLLLAALRWIGHALHYVGVDDVLARSAEAEVWSLYEPWTMLLALGGGAAAAAGLVADAAGTGTPPVRLRPLAPLLAAAAVAGLALGAAAGWSDPGAPKRGRVLIDERLTGTWEPAGRMLDTERYGDFSAYSLSAMVEHLSHRFAVTVNATAPYTEEALAAADVLVLKTPEQPLAAEEVAAIRRWVEDGGGLFLISDHTDLLGMSTHLRPLADPYGLDFRFDAVNDAGGGFNRWRGGWLPEHPVSAGLAEMEFMTGCSVTCRGVARPVLTLRQAASQGGDYGRASHFGARAPNPSQAQGLLVAAAAAPAGRGRILAFGDSTVLSSFAYPLHARDQFVTRTIAWLNRRASPARHLRWAFLGLAAAAAAAGLMGARAAPGGFVLACASAGLGLTAGASVAATVAAIGLQAPEPPPEVLRVGFVVEGGHAALPPVLGDTAAGLPPHANFSTFFQVPQRIGLETTVVPRDPRVLEALDALVLLNPDVELGQPEAPAGWVEAVRAWVEGGGRLLVLARREHLGHDHDRAPAYTAGWSLEHREVPVPALDLDSARIGKGWAARALGAEVFDLETMGHCMQYPGRDERLIYEVSYHIFRDLLDLRPADRRTWWPR